ncbi:MAG: hypothetical protein OEY56_04385 [Cyclobacteriaceae bacterium]|nr:hypothetical protein [Cyclobacteriaceae bacterium]
MKISVRLFIDDLEVAIQHYSGDASFDITDPTRQHELHGYLKTYFHEKLIIKNGDRPIEYVYLGGEMETDVLWCFMEVEKLKSFSQLNITNTLMKEVFDDQENLVHVRRDGVVKSCRMYRDKTENTLTWE